MTQELPTLDDAERFFAEQHGMEQPIDLPYPRPALPKYQEGRYGPWSISRGGPPVLRGYFNGVQPVSNENYVLKRHRGEQATTWMSLTPLEVESHMPHIAAARGHTVVVGLGLGLHLYNVLQRPEVTSVVVIEREESVLRLMRKRSDMYRWPNIEKLRAVIVGDAFRALTAKKVRKYGAVDSFYVDIWDTLGTEQARSHMVTLCKLYEPTAASWWGMEMDFLEWCTVHNKSDLGNGQRVDDAMAARSVDAWVDACAAYDVHLDRTVFGEAWSSLALRAVRNVTLY